MKNHISLGRNIFPTLLATSLPLALLFLPFGTAIFIHVEKELIETGTMAGNAATVVATAILSLETVRYFATSS